jgi:hypothetical protein
LRSQVVSKTVLGLPIGPVSFDDHPIVQAFRFGFDLPMNSTTVLDTFLGTKSKDLFLVLSERLPKDGDSISAANCICWVGSNISSKLKYEEAFKEQFFRYLSSPGHVDHPELHRHISNEAYVNYAQDSALSSRLFLRFVTGHMLVPSSQEIQVFTSYSFALFSIFTHFI